MPPTQQPFGHVLLSHAQMPFTVSHETPVHATQAWPPLPQRLLVSPPPFPSCSHVLPLQHPAQLLVVSHTHPRVESQRWPAAHSRLKTLLLHPQNLMAPKLAHSFDSVVSHGVLQLLPAPTVLVQYGNAVSQVLPLQQPAQLPGPHAGRVGSCTSA